MRISHSCLTYNRPFNLQKIRSFLWQVMVYITFDLTLIKNLFGYNSFLNDFARCMWHKSGQTKYVQTFIHVVEHAYRIQQNNCFISLIVKSLSWKLLLQFCSLKVLLEMYYRLQNIIECVSILMEQYLKTFLGNAFYSYLVPYKLTPEWFQLLKIHPSSSEAEINLLQTTNLGRQSTTDEDEFRFFQIQRNWAITNCHRQ